MKIHIGDAMKSPGTSYEFEFAQPWRAVDFAGDHVVMAEPVRVYGTYFAQSDGIIVQGGLRTVARLVCSRCLRSFLRPLEFEFGEEYYQGPPDHEKEGYPFEGDWIDLDEMVENNILLNLPLKKLCRPDCPGLCPVCGKDLSLGGCDCIRTAVYDGFSKDLLKLKALLEDDKEV